MNNNNNKNSFNEVEKEIFGNGDTLDERLKKFENEDSISYIELVDKHT